MRTVARHKRKEPADTLGRQQVLEVSRMPRLRSRLASGFFLDDRLGSRRGIGRRRHRRIGRIAAQEAFQLADLMLERRDACLQLGNASIALATSWANRAHHPFML